MLFRQTAAALLVSCITAGCAETSTPMSKMEAREFVEAALAPCSEAAGRLGAVLVKLDKGGSPVEAVHASRETAGACRGAAVQIDGERARLEPRVLAMCTAAGELGEILAETVEQALEVPGSPAKLATMEDASRTYAMANQGCSEVLQNPA